MAYQSTLLAVSLLIPWIVPLLLDKSPLPIKTYHPMLNPVYNSITILYVFILSPSISYISIYIHGGVPKMRVPKNGWFIIENRLQTED